jgi:hypothetical protein
MRLFASFLTLIPALLLIGLAYHGYADFASRASDGFSIQEAERQSGLVIAGMEGLLGLAFLYTALLLSASSRKREGASPLLARRERSAPPYSQRTREGGVPAYTQPEAPGAASRTLVRSGRARIEDLRRARSQRSNGEQP